MSVLDRLSNGLLSYFEFITFGRLTTFVLAVIALETTGIAVAVFLATPPYLPIPIDVFWILLLSLVLTLFLLGFLYVLLSGLGYRTYSVKFHQPRQIFKILVSYVAFALTITYIGYLFFVFPYTGRVVPKPADLGVGSVLAVGYVNSLAALFYTHEIITENSESKASAVSKFLTGTDNLRNNSLSDADSEPEKIVKAGRAIQRGLESSSTSDSQQLLSELSDWLDSFEQRNRQGQKKMVGDIPDNDTRFLVWEERYKTLQSIQESLYDMKNHALYKIVLSIKRKLR